MPGDPRPIQDAHAPQGTEAMNACKICGGPMRPLMVSWFCPNDCDLKEVGPAATAGPAWARVRRKMPRSEAERLDRLAHEIGGEAGRDAWYVFMLPGGIWGVVRGGELESSTSIPGALHRRCL